MRLASLQEAVRKVLPACLCQRRFRHQQFDQSQMRKVHNGEGRTTSRSDNLGNSKAAPMLDLQHNLLRQTVGMLYRPGLSKLLSIVSLLKPFSHSRTVSAMGSTAASASASGSAVISSLSNSPKPRFFEGVSVSEVSFLATGAVFVAIVAFSLAAALRLASSFRLSLQPSFVLVYPYY
ncbi:hypothetical protein MRB53_040432 [Persea americana]|nr:hypothetical protein MRB53_040432 [Persea americana]